MNTTLRHSLILSKLVLHPKLHVAGQIFAKQSHNILNQLNQSLVTSNFEEKKKKCKIISHLNFDKISKNLSSFLTPNKYHDKEETTKKKESELQKEN